MAEYTKLGTEEWALIATIDPASKTANTYYTDDIDMSLFEQIRATCLLGAIATGGTVAFSLVSGAAATPTAAITGKSATTLVGSPSGNDDNKQIEINLLSNELTEGHRYVRAKLVTATAAALAAVAVYGKAKDKPSSDHDLASVTQIVS